MSSPTSIADPMALKAIADLNDVAIDNENENKNAVDNNHKITSMSLLDARKGGTCASLYTEESELKKVLMAMAYGIELSNHNIGDCDVEPYASSKGKTHFVPLFRILLRRYNADVHHRK